MNNYGENKSHHLKILRNDLFPGNTVHMLVVHRVDPYGVLDGLLGVDDND